MSGPDPTPERLDAILDAREPAVTGAELEMVDLAATLRDAVPPAGPELRARVRAIEAAPSPSRIRRLTGSWRGRALIAAPVLAALAAVVIAAGVIGGNGPSGGSGSIAATTSAESMSGRGPSQATATRDGQIPTDARSRSAPHGPAASATPDATPVTVTIRVPAADVAARAAAARRIVIAAGGTIQEIPGAAGPGGIAFTATLPGAAAGDALAKFRVLAGQIPPFAATTPAASGGSATVTVLVVPGA